MKRAGHTRKAPRPSPAEMRDMIRAARKGDRDQRAKVLEVYRPYLVVRSFSKLDPRVQGKVAPSDAAQETIIKALHGFSRFGGENPDSLLRWLDKIHTRHVIDLHRQYLQADKRRGDLEVPFDGVKSKEFLTKVAQAVAKDASQSEELTRKDRASEVRAAFERLPLRQRQVLELGEFQGLTFDEIGSRLGIKASAARQARVRALQSLAQMLNTEH